MSTTCQTTMAAISTGLPALSLTLSRLVSKLRTRMLTRRRTVNGRTHQKPGRRTVPTYVPKNWMTEVWPGGTMTSEVATSTPTTIGSQIQPELWFTATTMPQTQRARTTTPNQPVTARAGRWVISTRAPSWPTGVTERGVGGLGGAGGTVLMAPTSR